VNATSAGRTVGIQDVGTEAIVVDAPMFSGADATSFIAVADGCVGKTLAARDQCTLQLAFRPASAGLLRDRRWS
jgi:hypothetical protein